MPLAGVCLEAVCSPLRYGHVTVSLADSAWGCGLIVLFMFHPLWLDGMFLLDDSRSVS